LEAQGRQHRALRMIFLRDGGAKDQQDAIAAEGLDAAAILLRRLARQRMQRLELALPGLQAPGLPREGGGHQRAT